MTDLIDALPVYQEEPTDQEVAAAEAVLKGGRGSFFAFMELLRTPMILAFVFVLFSLPAASALVRTVAPYTKRSDASVLFAKTLLFVAVVFALKYVSVLK